MKQSFKKVKQLMVAGIMLLLPFTKSFSQGTQFSLVLNEVTSNYNYGKSNSSLKPYKKNFSGLQAGGSFQVGLTRNVSIVPEIYFMMKGGTLKEANPITTEKTKLRLYTGEMPVLARIHIGRVFVNAGPYISYAFAGRMKTGGTTTIPEKSMAISFDKSTEGFKHWDFGWQAGVGYKFPIGKKQFGTEVRYSYGLTSISRDIERYNRGLKISFVAIKPWSKK